MIEPRGKRVLVVDDDLDTREVLAYALSHQGFIVLTAPDGRRGLEVARAWRPDVVLLDLLMPHLGGNELAAAMRLDPCLRRVPVVSMSGSPVHLGPASAVAHVQKPFALGEIVQALRSALLGSAPALAATGTSSR